jgi:environmental stress-induced protein Ves
VIRSPAAGQQQDESFDWRVSIARIDVSGPFSDFAGYWRFMVLLEGEGLTLEFDAAPPVRLRGVGDMADFDGGLATRCELLKGRCTDLNFMVSTAVRVLHAGVEHLQRAQPIDSDPRVTELVCVVAGDIDVEPAGGAPARLGPGDVAVLAAAGRAVGPGGAVLSGTGDGARARVAIRRALLRPAAGAAASALVFLASLDDNRFAE